MALIKEDVAIPARVQSLIKALVCDLCGAVSPRPDGWEPDFNDVDEVTISRKAGTRYPDSGSTTERIVDLCPSCFEHRLLPWLAENGATPRAIEQEW